jgi:glycerophosphoryl diester phosphodiesterase
MKPSIIAHRGASGYLPEHSLAAKALAYAMGADYLEQDVVASRDGELLVLHDLILDHVSDVATQFPARARDDGHFYCIDFDLDEIRRLKFGERLDPETGKPRYAGRFPRDAGAFSVNILEEEIRLVQSLNVATGRNVGIYPEIKHPGWHIERGFNIADNLLILLDKYNYLSGAEPIFVQCFDAGELRRLRASAGPRLPIIQLLSSRTCVDTKLLAEIQTYATGIGPSIGLIYRGERSDGTSELSDLVQQAHDAGLLVHPYTFRADDLPAGLSSFNALLELFLGRLRVDGVFTDFTDRVAKYLQERAGGDSV